MNNFLFLGGDMRSVYAAKKLREHYDCFVYGIDENETDVPKLREITKFKSLVLPLPVTRDGVNINTPYFGHPLPLTIIPDAVHEGGVVYCGRSIPELEDICGRHNLGITDYFEREELVVMNAMVTAESTLEILIRELKRSIFGSNVLLTGFGRISKVLAKYLITLGAHVTVTARKYSDLAWAEITGCKAVHLSKMSGIVSGFDVIINTVPAVMFGTGDIKNLKPGCLTVDLASKPGFEDMDNVIHALSLPGKSSPVSAGYIIADTIMNILAETEAGGEANA